LEGVADEGNRMAFLVDCKLGNFHATAAYFRAFDNSAAPE
jgi:hypothetical protein